MPEPLTLLEERNKLAAALREAREALYQVGYALSMLPDETAQRACSDCVTAHMEADRVLGLLRERAAPPSEQPDTEIGLSTEQLADLFPKVFKPTTVEDAKTEPFFTGEAGEYFIGLDIGDSLSTSCLTIHACFRCGKPLTSPFIIHPATYGCGCEQAAPPAGGPNA